MSEDYLIRGLEHGFIDMSVDAREEFIPQFLTNDPSRGEKVITSIKQEMIQCDEFMFSVAFITYDGINSLLSEFKYLKEHNIKGRILASQYQNFTQPTALRKLNSLGNIEVRIVTEEQMKMHSKCYIFSKNGKYDIIIGSSNLTNNALCSNGEWNLRFNSNASGEVVSDIVDEFNKIFDYATPVDEIWIEEYSIIYDKKRELRKAISEHDPSIFTDVSNTIMPNKMQAEALKNLQKLRNEGKDRALVISATGSGKTYLSAFDVKVFGGKFLYLVHRHPILNKSMSSFQNVLGNSVRIDKYDPETNNLSADCLFCTIQTMSKYEVYSKIPKDNFDYILIDEVHHLGAESYQKIVDYFKPKFLMGMTATPDRSDGYDIYDFFDHNIAYDIRLKEAMQYKLICPFHYFGIADLNIDFVEYEDKSDFSKIDVGQKVNHIIDNAKFYGFSGNRVKGIVFCSRISEAKKYSELFNARGYNTQYVSGETNKDEVEKYIEQLEADEGDFLDYIFTADLFNEGVDIPSVNQIVMLRPTESPIVYIQQLGRGLRLHKDKDFVVILDFIGNYEKNYNIPLALSDDHSCNKSEIRRFVATGDSIIPGNSTISFDEIAKEKIYKSIDRAPFSEMKFIVENYNILRRKLGKIPKLIDFKTNGSIDALLILSKFKSYHLFLNSKESDYSITFNDDEVELLNYVSKIIASGKRSLEIEMMELIVSGCDDIIGKMVEIHPDMVATVRNNIISIFNGAFYKNSPEIITENGHTIAESCSKLLKNNELREQIEDIISLGKENNLDYSDLYKDTFFVLNKMYTYADVCRLMNWASDVNAQNIGGYKYDSVTNTFSIFINYVKGENVLESQRYDDHFENRRTLIALSKSTEGIGSKNMNRVCDSKKNGTKIHLFVRKNKDDEGSKEFYYLGELFFIDFMNDEKPVKIRYGLEHEIRPDLYEYFQSDIGSV